MSKSKGKNKEKDYYDGDDDFRSVIRDKERRKEKRLMNAIRSKNVKDLLELEDDDEAE